VSLKRWPTAGLKSFVLHQPLLDKLGRGERTPDLLGWRRDLPFDDDGERIGRGGGHDSLLHQVTPAG
jgi:hypothetical protein